MPCHQFPTGVIMPLERAPATLRDGVPFIEALRRHFGDRIEIAGENTGVHLVVWLDNVKPRELDAVIARAAKAGVVVYSIAPAYTRPLARAGLLFGDAALTAAEIRAGIQRLAEAF